MSGTVATAHHPELQYRSLVQQLWLLDELLSSQPSSELHLRRITVYGKLLECSYDLQDDAYSMVKCLDN